MFHYQKIAITGATGFIGRSLLRQLLNSGYKIKVLDFDGKNNYPANLEVIKGDLLAGTGIDSFLKDSEVLIHLAGQVLPGTTTMKRGNATTTMNLISKATKHAIKKIIFSSTVAVYGGLSDKVFKESDICHPDTEYGVSKYDAEEIIKDWAKENNRKYTIFRFFSIYGPGNNKGVIYNLCNDFIKKGVITIYGDGKQERDLIYVEDVVEALVMAVNSAIDGIYNIGTGRYYSILDIISVLEKISGKKIKVVFEKQDKSKVGNIHYSTVKFEKKTGWSPKISLDQGVAETYRFLIKKYNENQ